MFRANFDIHVVSYRHHLCSVGHALDVRQIVSTLHCAKVTLVDKERHELVVDEEEVQFVSEALTFCLYLWLSKVEESKCSVEVINHHFFILAQALPRFNHTGVVLPHLNYVDNLPEVLSRRADQFGKYLVSHTQIFLGANTLDSGQNVLGTRSLELEVVALVSERLDLLTLPVVANAHYWGFCVLDHLNQSCQATPVAIADTVDLVHDNHALLLTLAILLHHCA